MMTQNDQYKHREDKRPTMDNITLLHDIMILSFMIMTPKQNLLSY